MKFMKAAVLALAFASVAASAEYYLGVIAMPHLNGGIYVDYVSDYNGLAAKCGIEKGDVVFTIAGLLIETPEQAANLLVDLDVQGVSGFEIGFHKPLTPALSYCRVEKPLLDAEPICAPPAL
jgi:hypothetical protein